MLKHWRLYLVVAYLMFLPLAGFALQVEPEPGAPPDASAALVGLIQAVIPLAVPFIVWGVRKVLPKVPRVALPVVALLLGVGANYLAALATGGEHSLVLGALLGAASVFVREIVDTVNEHKLSS